MLKNHKYKILAFTGIPVFLRILVTAFAIVAVIIAVLLLADRSYPTALEPTQDQASAYIIRNVRVVAMDQEQAREDWAVVVQDGIITALGPNVEINTPEGALVIDGRGKTLLPGLIDMHVHIFDEVELAAFLSHGVTTVRNMSGMSFHLKLQERLANKSILGPRLFTSGPILNEKGGRNVNILQQLVDGPKEARAAVRSQYAQGFRMIKVYSNLSIASYEAILDEAKKLDIPVFGHPVEGKPPADKPHEKKPFEHMLDDDLVNIEHMESVVWHALHQDMDEEKVRVLARQFATAGLALDPTLVVHFNLTELIRTKGAHAHRDEMEMFNPLVSWFDQETIDFWANYEENNENRLGKFYMRSVKIFHEEGVKMVVGTDAGVMVTLPGSSVTRELELFVKAGLSPFQALQSATIFPAQLLQLENEVGQIRIGYRADLILVEGNPLNDISALEHPAGVMLNGIWLDKADMGELHEAAKHPPLLRTLRRFTAFWLSK